MAPRSVGVFCAMISFFPAIKHMWRLRNYWLMALHPIHVIRSRLKKKKNEAFKL